MLITTTDGAFNVELAQSKSVDHTPDVTSDNYWDTHHIAVVRLTNIGKDSQGGDRITYQVVKQISEGPLEQTRSVRLTDMWFGSLVEEPPQLAVNDHLVIYYPKAAPSPIVANKLDSDPDHSDLVGSLLQIARFRANADGVQALPEGVFSKDAVVAIYCLNRLLNRPSFAPPNDYLARLAKLRDDEAHPAELRVKSSRLFYELQGKALDSEEEYSWLKHVTAESTLKDWSQLLPFVERLLQFGSKRGENIAFFTQLVQDENRNEAVRIAAYSSFTDPRLFYFSKPDAESDRIFDECIQMLKDSNPLIRSAGAALLQNISVKVDSSVRQTYLGKAKAAIEASAASERNEDTRNQLQHFLEILRRQN